MKRLLILMLVVALAGIASAELFVNGAIERLDEEHNKRKYRETFFRSISLILYLLRVRRAYFTIFDPGNEEEMKPFKKAMTLIDVRF